MLKQVLTIAGSDSGGGAGVQADLKAMSANGTYAMSVITSITAQNTTGVTAIHDLPESIVEAQIDAIFADFDVAAVKTGCCPRPHSRPWSAGSCNSTTCPGLSSIPLWYRRVDMTCSRPMRLMR